MASLYLKATQRTFLELLRDGLLNLFIAITKETTSVGLKPRGSEAESLLQLGGRGHLKWRQYDLLWIIANRQTYTIMDSSICACPCCMAKLANSSSLISTASVSRHLIISPLQPAVWISCQLPWVQRPFSLPVLALMDGSGHPPHLPWGFWWTLMNKN